MESAAGCPLLLKRIGDVADRIREEDAPRGRLFAPFPYQRPMLIVQCCPFSAIQALSTWMAFSSRCAAGGMTSSFIAALTLELSRAAKRRRLE